MASIEKAIQAMYWAADSDRVGYSQSDRESLQERDFFGPGQYNTDCSKLVIEALQFAGFDTGGATYTGNMSSNLCARGWARLPVDGNPRPGDLLLNDADHVAMMLYDGNLGQASIGERGLVSGGARGDQTGSEVNVRRYYSYPWDCYLRYMGPKEQNEEDDLKTVNNEGGPVYRLYNPNAGGSAAHHFTPYAGERDALVKAGWKSEGVAFEARQGGRHPVFRMYNPNNADHLHTVGYDEACKLQKAGWVYEGVPFFANSTGTAVHTLYNPNTGEHFMTASESESAALQKAGWKYDRGFTV